MTVEDMGVGGLTGVNDGDPVLPEVEAVTSPAPQPAEPPDLAAATGTQQPLYEQWLSYPDKRVFVPEKEHSKYASSPGWWCVYDWSRGLKSRKYTAEGLPA
jgi:hypothetical protein